MYAPIELLELNDNTAFLLNTIYMVGWGDLQLKPEISEVNQTSLSRRPLKSNCKVEQRLLFVWKKRTQSFSLDLSPASSSDVCKNKTVKNICNNKSVQTNP